MARDPVPPSASGVPSLLRPWSLMGVAAVLTVLGLIFWTFAPVAWVICMVAGLIVAGFAVSRRLQQPENPYESASTLGRLFAGRIWVIIAREDRIESAGLLGAAAFLVLLDYFSLEKEWVSAQLMACGLIVAAVFGAFLVLLPSVARRVAVSLVILFHFGGIVLATTLVPPPNLHAPWVSMQLWTRVYNPYLQYIYQINAYHFYSPDPGPPSLVWFRVAYNDGSHRWVTVPNRRESPVGVHFQRMLALTESITTDPPSFPLNDPRQKEAYDRVAPEPYDRDYWNTPDGIYARRIAGIKKHPEIKLLQDAQPSAQYVEPNHWNKKMIASYAVHVAWSTPHPTDPKVGVHSVKVYRLLRRTISPQQVALGMDADDARFFLPYFLGEFYPNGNMVDPKEPFLYWLLPIARVSPNYPEDHSGIYSNYPPEAPSKVLNCLKIHAGDMPEGME